MAAGCHLVAKFFPIKKQEKCVPERRALFKAENELNKANSAIFLAPEALTDRKKDRNAKRLNEAQVVYKTSALDFKICCGDINGLTSKYWHMRENGGFEWTEEEIAWIDERVEIAQQR